MAILGVKRLIVVHYTITWQQVACMTGPCAWRVVTFCPAEKRHDLNLAVLNLTVH